ncbi:ChaN family lipoprotein [Ferrimonas balearica]|uniref:ChaN family lipoprotein n=1 Tax=Ferrimonas balearica TaxID=44012 RepID=UPI001C9A04E8|nr:ChaN family lipoprotein [Ferrimonas balearica]MBY5991336.1 ChaN family lipoprotein [Ferrimonas balearica]
MKPSGWMLTMLLMAGPVWALEPWQSPYEQDHPLVGAILDTQSGERLSAEQLYQRLSGHPLVLVGEKHDNPDHHALERALYQALSPQSAPRTLVLEMLSGGALLKPNPGLSELDDTALQVAIEWPQGSWPWQDYAELVRLALANGSALGAANLTRPTIRAVYEQGADALDSASQRATMAAIEPRVREPWAEVLYEQHCGALPMAHMTPMVKVQVARDAAMAGVLAQTEGPALLISGGFHAAQRDAVPAHLRERGLDSVSVLLLEVDSEHQDWREYREAIEADFHYLWFTPKSTTRDYCDDLAGTH